MNNTAGLQYDDVTNLMFLSSLIGVGYSQKKIENTTADAS